MEYSSTTKRNKVLIYAIMWVNLKNVVLCKKPDTKGHKLYDSIYIKYLE